MICAHCRPWCACTQRQLDARLTNLRAHPHVESFCCPRCGSPDWATTDEMVVEDLPAAVPEPFWDHGPFVTITIAAAILVAFTVALLALM